MWERKPASPDDDEFQDIYAELDVIDPESVERIPQLAALVRKRRAEAAARRGGAKA
jgi:hypothetical protein